jgi:beta-N-acetylhexosaminidase
MNPFFKIFAPSHLCAFALSLLLLLSPQHSALSTPNLSLEQKVTQLFMVGFYGQQLNDSSRSFLQTWQPGSFALFNSNAGTPETVTGLTNDLQQTVIDSGSLPMLIAVDQEGGLIARLKDGFTEWPVPMLLTASANTDLASRVGTAFAQELKAVGINMNLAPVADLNTNPNNPVIGRRSFGTDPELTGQILAAYISGMQAEHVIATAKHFPGHGDTSVDSHTGLPIVTFDRSRLDQIELAPFRWTMAAGVETVMTAHIYLPALESQENLPASLSHSIVTGLLRNELGYTGLIMTDALEMDAVEAQFTHGDAAIQAILAGNDIVAFGAHLSLDQQAAAMQAVINAVYDGIIPESRIDESLQRILDVKSRYGVLDWQPLDPTTARDRMNLEAHAELVKEMFRAGITVAYDNNNRLPLTSESNAAIVYPANRPNLKRECSPYSATIQWIAVSDSPTPQEIAWAVDAGRRVDTVVVFTQNAYVDITQQTLVKSLPPEKTVAVALWSPYDWLKFPDVSAYVATYSPLAQADSALCAILFGSAPAQGQLPIDLSPALSAGRRSD